MSRKQTCTEEEESPQNKSNIQNKVIFIYSHTRGLTCKSTVLFLFNWVYENWEIWSKQQLQRGPSLR